MDLPCGSASLGGDVLGEMMADKEALPGSYLYLTAPMVLNYFAQGGSNVEVAQPFAACAPASVQGVQARVA
jgi:hypothetical protein